MKKRIYLWGFVCILLCVLFSVLAYADESPQNLETESVPEIASTSTITISPADNFVKIEEQQQYTCVGATGTPTWSIRDSGIATVDNTGLVTGVAQGQTYLTAYVDGVYITITIKVGAIEEGTYYIGNRMSGFYMELQNATATEGTPVQQWQFYGQTKSRWIITLESTGVYSIRSALTNYYIGVKDSSPEEGATINQYASIANQRGRQWKIETTSDGTYKFHPYYNQNMAISVPETGSTVKGTDLVQLISEDITDYRNEWVLGIIDDEWNSYPIIYLANLDVLYDHAYLQRYPNAENRINTMLYAIKDKFMREFGVYVNYISPSIYTSFADANCPSHYTVGCECISNDRLCQNTDVVNGEWVYQTYHHNNIYNNQSRVPFPDMNQTLRIVFFGREECVAINGICDNDPYNGLTYSNLGLCGIMCVKTLNGETRVVLHEFGHLYDAPDHYGGSQKTTAQINAEYNTTLFNSQCIYGENRLTNEVQNNLIICDGCLSVIQASASKYIH